MNFSFGNKSVTALFTVQEASAGAQIPWLPDEMSKAKPLLSSLEPHEEALLDRIRQRTDDSAQWYKYARSFDPLVRRLSGTPGRIKSELR